MSVSFVGRAQSSYPLPTFTPPTPTSRDPIVAVLKTPGICLAEESGTSVDGSVVRTDIILDNCVIGAPGYLVDTAVTFGPLPAGIYSYLVYHDWQFGSGPELVSTQQLVVLAAAEPIPSLGLRGRVASILLLAGIGGLFVSRRCV